MGFTLGKAITKGFTDFFSFKNVRFEIVSPEDKTLLFNRWKSVYYINGSREENKQYRHQYYLIFSYDRANCETELNAINLYTKLKPQDYYILLSPDKTPGFFCFQSAMLSYKELLAFKNENRYIGDVYVIGVDFSWTFIITSEDWCGPFFSTASLQHK